MRSAIAVAFVPCNIMDIATATVLCAAALPATAGSVFPLSLCGQTEAPTSDDVQVSDELLTVVSTDALYWKTVAIEP